MNTRALTAAFLAALALAASLALASGPSLTSAMPAAQAGNLTATFTLTGATHEDVLAQWSFTPASGKTFAYYDIWYKACNDAGWGSRQSWQNSTQSTNSHTITGLTNGACYKFRLSAWYTDNTREATAFDGVQITIGSPTPTPTNTPTPIPVTAPAIGTADRNSNSDGTQVAMVWSQVSMPSGTTFSGYALRVCSGTAAECAAGTNVISTHTVSAVSTTTYTFTGLTANQAQAVALAVAYAQDGNNFISAYSSKAVSDEPTPTPTNTPTPIPVTAPAIGTADRNSNSDGTQVAMVWSQASMPSGTTFSGYALRVCSGTAAECAAGTNVISSHTISAVSTTTYTFTGLTANQAQAVALAVAYAQDGNNFTSTYSSKAVSDEPTPTPTNTPTPTHTPTHTPTNTPTNTPIPPTSTPTPVPPPAKAWTPEPPGGAVSTGTPQPRATATAWATPRVRTNYYLNERFGDNFIDVKSTTFWLVLAMIVGVGFTISFKNAVVGALFATMVLFAGVVMYPPEWLDGMVNQAGGLPVLPILGTLLGALSVAGIVIYLRQGR